MAYTQHTWVNGETITADLLNNMEHGINEANINHDLVDEKLETVTENIETVQGNLDQSIEETNSKLEQTVSDINSKIEELDDKFVLTAISGDNGTAYVWNEVTGGGARYENTDGTISFVGVNNGGTDDLTAQIYSVNETEGTINRFNVYNDGIYYMQGISKSDEEYQNIHTSDYEIAVQKDINEAIANIPSVDLSNYTEEKITSDKGSSYVWNETTGGGARFEHTDGSISFVGVNDGGTTGLAAQLYVDTKTDSGSWLGTVLNAYYDGIYYYNQRDTGDGSYTGKDVDNELAVKGDVNKVEEKADEALKRTITFHIKSTNWVNIINTYTKGDKATLNSSIIQYITPPEGAEKEIVEFNTDPEGKGFSYAVGEEITVDDSLILYGIWKTSDTEDEGQSYITEEDLADYVTNTSLSTTLADYYTSDYVLNNFASKNEISAYKKEVAAQFTELETRISELEEKLNTDTSEGS